MEVALEGRVRCTLSLGSRPDRIVLLLKFQDDIELVEPEISALLKGLR